MARSYLSIGNSSLQRVFAGRIAECHALNGLLSANGIPFNEAVFNNILSIVNGQISCVIDRDNCQLYHLTPDNQQEISPAEMRNLVQQWAFLPDVVFDHISDEDLETMYNNLRAKHSRNVDTNIYLFVQDGAFAGAKATNLDSAEQVFTKAIDGLAQA